MEVTAHPFRELGEKSRSFSFKRLSAIRVEPVLDSCLLICIVIYTLSVIQQILGTLQCARHNIFSHSLILASAQPLTHFLPKVTQQVSGRAGARI